MEVSLARKLSAEVSAEARGNKFASLDGTVAGHARREGGHKESSVEMTEYNKAKGETKREVCPVRTEANREKGGHTWRKSRKRRNRGFVNSRIKTSSKFKWFL